MRRIAALALWTPLLMAQADISAVRTVSAVRHWSLGDVTRIAVEVSADFTFRTERLHNPERVYFDILNSRPRVGQRPIFSETLDDDPRVKRLRVAETTPGVTRVVLDLSGSLNVTTSQLANPDRLMIEVRAGAPATAAPPTAAPPTATPPAATPPTSPSSADPQPQLPDAPRPGPIPPAKSTVKAVAPDDLASAEMVTAEPAKNQLGADKPAKTDDTPAGATDASKPEPLPHEPLANSSTPSSLPPLPTVPSAPSGSVHRDPASYPVPAETPRSTRRSSTGADSSLARGLGLKISRVVIDPGHGGHDQGTQGPHGLIEKELVLDVSKRVGKLIEDKMGAEVIYTRSDDTFVSLEGRTALANEKKADLFLSIHANSSPVTRIAGVETYYLNFPDSRDAIEVAARENAAAQESLFELRDLIQKIALHDKAEESREFANRIQTALFALSTRNFPGTRNRGVKKAPFVVLIGAQMPSILAEIGFLSNPKEESLLKRSDYRQKIAEALYQGVKRYADSLSHFQVAQQTQNQP